MAAGSPCGESPPPLHLRRLEAEAIGVLREVAAEFRYPVLLYSMGKDSSVLLHLAREAFHPARLPMPLLHGRHDLEVSRDDRISRRDCAPPRAGADRSCKSGRARARDQPDRNSTYEPPQNPDLRLATIDHDAETLADQLVEELRRRAILA